MMVVLTLEEAYWMKKWLLAGAIFLTGGWFGTQYLFDVKPAATQVVDTDIHEQVYQGDLLLVNEDYPVKEPFIRQDIVDANTVNQSNHYVVLYNNTFVSKHISEPFEKLMKKANEDGVNHFVISSGFRGFKEQQKLYEQYGDGSALPAGYSEHNLGLSLDIGSSQGRMEDTIEGEWLAQNVWQFGFVMRYPEHKTHITKIKYEPWHIRYVGLPHSVIMHDNDWVLEEYVEELKQQQTFRTTVNGTSYIIEYYDGSRFSETLLPKDKSYTISGDNKGGIIVAIAS